MEGVSLHMAITIPSLAILTANALTQPRWCMSLGAAMQYCSAPKSGTTSSKSRGAHGSHWLWSCGQGRVLLKTATNDAWERL